MCLGGAMINNANVWVQENCHDVRWRLLDSLATKRVKNIEKQLGKTKITAVLSGFIPQKDVTVAGTSLRRETRDQKETRSPEILRILIPPKTACPTNSTLRRAWSWDSQWPVDLSFGTLVASYRPLSSNVSQCQLAWHVKKTLMKTWEAKSFIDAAGHRLVIQSFNQKKWW